MIFDQSISKFSASVKREELAVKVAQTGRSLDESRFIVDLALKGVDDGIAAIHRVVNLAGGPVIEMQTAILSFQLMMRACESYNRSLLEVTEELGAEIIQGNL
jgi:hypothetical protein